MTLKIVVFFFFFLLIIHAEAQLPEVGIINNPVKGSLTDQMCSGTTVLKETFDGTPGFVPSCQGWSQDAINSLSQWEFLGYGNTPTSWPPYSFLGLPKPNVTPNPCQTLTPAQITKALNNPPPLLQMTVDPALADVKSRIKNHNFVGTPTQPPVCTTNTPSSGNYSITNQNCNNDPYWYVFNDHTNPPKGNFLIIDATNTANYFYQYTVSNICSGTSLSFSVWLSSISKIKQNNGTGAPWPDKANLTIELYDPSNNVIVRFNTGNLKDGYEDDAAHAGKWKQYGFEFIIPNGINSVTMKIKDNGLGSQGNDFVLDDIEIRICNPPITVSSNPVLCKTTVPVSATFNNNNNITGGTIIFRWEYSTDNINWNILGADTTKPLNAVASFTSTVIENSLDAAVRYYRIVAGSPGTYTTNCKMISASHKPNVDNTVCGTQVSLTSDTICKGETTKLKATVLKGKRPYVFTWSSNVVLSQIVTNDSISEITVNPAITATYSVSVSDATNTNPGQAQGTVTTIVVPTLSDVCNDKAAFTLPDADPVNCSISGVGVTGKMFDPSVAGVGTKTINYSLSTKSCATTINVNNCGIQFTVSSDTICKGESGPITFTVNITKGNAPFIYKWSDDNITNTTSITTFTHIISTAPISSTTYTVTITEALNAQAQAQSIITVIEPPPLTPVCVDNAAFTLPTGIPSNCLITGAGVINSIFDPRTAGAGTVTINYSLGNKSCPTSQIINRLPTIEAGLDVQLCRNGGDTSLLATSTDVVTFLWDDQLTNTPSRKNLHPSVTTLYKLTVTDATTGCMNKDSVSIIVNDSLTPVINGKFSICKGENTVLSVNGGTTYNWSDGSAILGATNQITVLPMQTTTYYVTVINGSTCKGSNKTVVTVNPVPIADFSVDQVSGCQPLTVLFTDKTFPAASNYTWNFGDVNSGGNNISNKPNPQHIFNEQGSYDISLSVSTAPGCKDDTIKQKLILVNAKPRAAFVFSPEYPTNFNPTVNFTDLSIGTNMTWVWNFDDANSASNNSSTIQNPVHDFVDGGNHDVSLTVTSGNGCTDNIVIPVLVKAEFTFWAPNAFTPNGDGVNDFFQPKGLGINEKDYHMYIFTRWGEKIFEANDLNLPWDGTAPGTEKLCPDGIYKWLVFFNDEEGKKHISSGTITLLK